MKLDWFASRMKMALGDLILMEKLHPKKEKMQSLLILHQLP